jgi:hypothetical protein
MQPQLEMNYGSLRIGMTIWNRTELHNQSIQRWRYGRECADVGGGVMRMTPWDIIEVGPPGYSGWVRAAGRNSAPPRILKITADELSHAFTTRSEG